VLRWDNQTARCAECPVIAAVPPLAIQEGLRASISTWPAVYAASGATKATIQMQNGIA
jgi:hypothetical protein